MVNQYVNPYYNQIGSLMPQAQAPPTIQNGGLVIVKSVEEAYNYPVAPGNCVTFKVENEPTIIEKTMGFSQLESPKIEEYELVRMNTRIQNEEQIPQIDMSSYAKKDEIPSYDLSQYALKSDIEELKETMSSLKESIDSIQIVKTTDKKGKKVTNDD